MRAAIVGPALVALLSSSCSGPKGGGPPVLPTGTSLGTLTFTLDDDSAVSSDVDSSGDSLSTTDAAGNQWTLDLQKGSLSGKTTIRMTPLLTVDSGEGPPVTAGVVLEPEGLLLMNPAALVITFAADGPQNVFSFDSDGSNLWFAGGRTQGDTYVIPLEHFSGVAAGPRTWTTDQLCDYVTAGYRNAADVTPPSGAVTIPTPPKLNLDCWGYAGKGDSARKLAGIWTRQVMEPEFSLLEKLFNAERAEALACSSFNNPNGSITPEMKPLLSRLAQKIDLLIQLPKDADTSLPVTMAMLVIERYFELIDVGEYDRGPAVLADAQARAAQARDEYLRRLREDHDYQAVTTVVELERDAELLGATSSLGDIAGKLQDAYRFEVEISVQMQASYAGYLDSDGDAMWGADMSIQLQANGTFDTGTGLSGGTFPLLIPRSISMQLQSDRNHELPRPAPNTQDHLDCDSTAACSYDDDFALSLDACDDTATWIGLNAFGPATPSCPESCTFFDGGDGSNNYSDDKPGTGAVDNWAEQIFEKYYQSSGSGSFYKFVSPVKNRQAEAIRSDASGTVASPTTANGTLSLTVTHAPR